MMNSVELTSILKMITSKETDFLGVIPCNHLNDKKISRLPAMLVANTHPSHMPGEHCNPPTHVQFPPVINTFLKQNCTEVFYSTKQVQDSDSVACGQHTVFFLYHMQSVVSYDYMDKYGSNLNCNDVMVYKFLNKIRPGVCQKYDFTRVQCVKPHM
ncbi:hypothetical protein EXN66_Car000123 [Channa argus]|uniref:Ubiquitin-like protease family profile domain-containing protein n=1 Tax=Channa argus TaxID=215402 RepID=A0A6G1QWF5_CHAAH|nr:hypothetical protein EXN66_Car000123 [Channa argus]